MTVILALLARAWPALLAGAVLGLLTGWLTHKADSVAYSRLQATYAGFQAQVADERAAAEKAANDTIRAQLAERQANDTRNQGIINDLQAKLSTVAATHDALTDELRHALKNSSCRGAVPETGHQPGTAPTSQAASNGPLVGLLSDAISECAGNRLAQTALIAQIKPQLEVNP